MCSITKFFNTSGIIFIIQTRRRNFQHFGSDLLIKLLQRRPEESKLTVKLTTRKREKLEEHYFSKIFFFIPVKLKKKYNGLEIEYS